MVSVRHAPRFSAEDAIRLASERFQIRGTATPLPSERDQNFLLATDGGERFVLKIANAREQRPMLEAQNAALAHLAGTGICPVVVAAGNGEEIVEARGGGRGSHYARLLTYLPGVPIGSLKRHSEELLEGLGRTVATVDRELLRFDHPAAHREFPWDLARAPEVVKQYRPLVTDPDLNLLLARFADRYEREVRPRTGGLRRSVIHNDANDYNVLAGGGEDWYSRNQQVTGLVDFGDMVFSYTVAGLAVAIAYAMLDKEDALAAAAPVVSGYHAVLPLTDEELEVLFDLACMRLCISVSMAANQTVQRPGDPYLSISQEPVRGTLPKLAAIHPRLTRYVFRDACGLPPVPHSARVTGWLAGRREEFGSLLPPGAATVSVQAIDLGAGSPLVSSNPAENAGDCFRARIHGVLGDAIGFGGYGEARTFYSAPAGRNGVLEEPATIHLGVDLTLGPGTEVRAPIGGTVHGFGDDGGEGGRGPVIVLEHETGAGLAFFTVYGHLSAESLSHLEAGRPVAKGERIGWVGEPEENGGWWPHLHFQIVTDLLGESWEFPRLGRASQRHVWESLCPDPNLVLGFPAGEQASRRTTDEILDERRRRIGRNLSISYRRPLRAVRGWMQYLYDETGRPHLDAYNNVAHVGHSHPRVVEAIRRQAGILNTNTRYLQDQLVTYAARLGAHFPAPLSVCFFVNSGSEANELAIRLARARTGQKDMIVLEAAYHGHTNTLIDVSPYKHDGLGGRGAPSWVHKLAIPDTFRGAFRRDDTRAGWKYAQQAGETIERLHREGKGVCAYLAETCPSVAGQILPPDGYFTEVYRLVREAGGLAIADEVQTGFGRLGTHFWAFEKYGVVPDIVVLGKPIGNGYPLGAVVTTPEIAAAFDNGMEFFSTFGGSTLSCAAGMAVLEVVEQEDLQEHSRVVGDRLLRGLRRLPDRYPIVADVRGSGLFVGVELVREGTSLEPATEEAAFIANRFRDHGILLGTDGPYHNVIKIRGPMPFNEDDADLLVEVFEKILNEDFVREHEPAVFRP